MTKPSYASKPNPQKENSEPAGGKRALLSLSDKRGMEAFAADLVKLGYEIISTGGTKKELEKNGIPVTSVEDITKFPECFGGRVKTMHPLIMGGLLFRRDNKDDLLEAKKHGIEPIDLVAITLYPFEKTALKENVMEDELIEQIDIGGPTILRSAAKNYSHVTVICDPDDYGSVIDALKKNNETSLKMRKNLALKVFNKTSSYDKSIALTLGGKSDKNITLSNELNLRYGENPHQWGKYYDIDGHNKKWNVLQEEKHMSYLNILDADGATNLVCEFDEPTVACIKHANPSGVASHTNIAEAFQRSYDADRLSAFGVIIAINRKCPKEVVEKILDQKIFTEVLIAPDFEDAALHLLKSKPKIRAIKFECPRGEDQVLYRSMLGGMLVQNADTKVIKKDDLKCVTNIKPTEEQIKDMLFAWKIVKHAKSNAIVFAKDMISTGIGCGQTSRYDSTVIASRKAGEKTKGSVMASDAFFPFADSVEEAAKHGIAAIIQPGGSIRDEEVIAKANELGIVMVVTGVRGFRH